MYNLYGVFVNADMTEGRGPMLLKSAFEDEKSAIKVAQENDPYWHSGDKIGGMTEVRVIPIYKDYADYKNNNDEAVRQRALAKLTNYEKKVLGVK